MHTLTGWFIRNPVAANLLMAFILFMGVMTTLSIRIEGFPRIPPDSIIITTSFDNATAGQVDELVTRKIEKALEGLDGVRSISAQSNNGTSVIVVRRAGGKKLQTILDKVRLRVDGIADLPAKSRRPVIETSGFDIPALYVNLHGDADPVTLQTLSQRLKEDLLAEPEISRLKIWGLHEREMRIEITPQTLLRYNLTLAEITDRIRASSLDFQAGMLRTYGGSIYLRTDAKARFVRDFAPIPIVEKADGTIITLGDIATIKDTFAEGNYLFRFNGMPTSGMEVLVGSKENLLVISEVANKVVNQFRKQLPPNISLTIWGDSSNYIADRLALLRSNGLQGLLLVGLILSLFLNVRLAFWVAMGIPVSVMGALAVAGSRWVDYSLNDITTFGLIIALGILVDDAVVVGESVFEERRKTKDPILGTEKGVGKVAVATVFGVLTTIAAFFPLLMLDNPLGKVLAGFSGVVILALTFSLIESKFILPAHLAALDINKKSRSPIALVWGRVQSAAQAGLAYVRDSLFAPVVAGALRHRYATLILFLAAASLGLGMIYKGKIKTVFFPDVPGQIISINVKMDARAPFELTRTNLERIQAIGTRLNTDYQAEKKLSKPPIRAMFLILENATTGMVYAELTPVADRPNLGILEILSKWREETGVVEGANEMQFSGSEEMAGGFQLQLQSKDKDLLKLVSKDLQTFLAQIDGTHNIRDSLTSGQPELELTVKPEARSLGFDTQTLASQIGYAFGGAEVQKSRRGNEELRVLVLNAKSARDSMDDLLQSRIRSKNGEWIPLSSVVDIKSGYVASTIHRKNGKLTNTVRATVDRTKAAPEEISQAVFEQFWPDMAKKYPSVSLSTGGELEEMVEIRGGLIHALIIAAVLIYVLMAVPLKSYWQPFVILSIVPFGFVSAAIGHLIMDKPLSLLSFFGMLALTGVIVNDCLVMITRFNQAREGGMPLHQALQEASIGRFQAIFLTTATTVAGLLPLLTETSEQAQYLIPAAISLAFGELFGTALTLILVPVLLAIGEDVKKLLGFGVKPALAVQSDLPK